MARLVARVRIGRAAWLLLALALCLRLAFVVATPHYTPLHDDHDYDRLACGIVAGAGYRAWEPATPPGTCVAPHRAAAPTAYRPPAYPVALAGVYAASAPLHLDRWTVARVAQALLGAFAAGLVGLVAGLVWGRPAGLAALALAAVHLPFAMVGAALVSETLFVTLELAAVACALQANRAARPWGWIGATGLFVGLAWLTRTNGVLLVLPLAIAAWTALRSAGRRRAVAAAGIVAVVAAAALTVAPWTARNAARFHAFVPVSTETGPTLAGTYNDVSRRDASDPGAWFLPRDVPALMALVRPIEGEAARDDALTSSALHFAVGHPAFVLHVAARNTLGLAEADPREWDDAGTGLDMPPAAGIATAAWFWVVVLLAVVGVATGSARGAPRWLWLVPLLFFASAALVISGVRFRMPMEPFLLIVAGAGLAHLVTRSRTTAVTPGRGRWNA